MFTSNNNDDEEDDTKDRTDDNAKYNEEHFSNYIKQFTRPGFNLIIFCLISFIL